MRCERTNIIKAAAEVVVAARFERDRIQLARQSLLAKSQQRISVGVDADINRRLQADLSLQLIAFETGAKGAKNRVSRSFFSHKLRASHKAIGKPNISIGKMQGAN